MSIDIIDWREQTKSIAGLRRSRTFLKSASNAWYSVADYLAQPALLLAVTPLLVRRLGLDQYGIWMLATALTGSFSALNLGFGDATVKYVATYRGRNDLHGMIRLVRAAITINTLLGALVAILMLFVAPALVRHVFKIVPGQHTLAVQAIQLAGGVLFFKSLESVFACILRAHEQYGASARLSVFIKAVTVTFSIAVAVFGYGVVAIMLVTLVTAAVGAVLQAMAALRLVPGLSILPTLDRGAWREIGGFGLYTWMQSVAGMIFTQGDRLLIGGFMGTTAVAYYTICVQVAQPVHGLAASAFNFLFPHLSARHSAGDTQGVRRVFRLATIA